MKKLLFLPFFAYLPIFLQPQILINRNNDLANFFSPLLLFIKNEILFRHQIPLWNPHLFSGTPLLPDPQSQLFYPGTLIFVLFPITIAFLLSLYLHGLIGSLGVYLLCKKLNCRETTSLFAATIFIVFPRTFGYLEAGHWGLFTAYAWIPVALFLTLMWGRTKRILWASMLVLVLFFILAGHVFIYFCAAILVMLFFAIIARSYKAGWNEIFGRVLFLIISSFAFGAISLLPQFAWATVTTRSILLTNPDLYPKWSGILDIFSSFVWLTNGSINSLWAKDSEKWIMLGILPSILAFFAFVRLRVFLKIIVVLIIGFIFAVAFSQIFASLSAIKLMRITTRPWVFIEATALFLCVLWFEKRIKQGMSLSILIVAFAILVEYTFLSWARILKPVSQILSSPDSLLETIATDKDIYRVYCTVRCIPQYTAIERSLELVEGYGTLQQENYFKHSWSLVGAYWNYYTLAIPPMGTAIFEKPQPSTKILGEYNVKYVLSPYPLLDKDFLALKEYDGIVLYKNKAFKQRFNLEDEGAKFEILAYSPNIIKLAIHAPRDTLLTFANVASPGWSASINRKQLIIAQTPISQMRVSVPKGDYILSLTYMPIGFKIGTFVTVFAVFTHLILIFFQERKIGKYNKAR